MKKQHPIKLLIKQGEGLQLDFKFEISDAAKIARSLVAFANTKGGKLLVGVKDNGSIAGIRSEEEIYMIDNAAKRFCKPEINFTSREWNIEGKKILEVNIARSKNYPHKAPDHKGKYKAYYRHEDENLLVNGVQLKVWTKQNSLDNINITYGETEQELMKHLNTHNDSDFITLQDVSGLNKHNLENLLSDFILMDLIELHPENDSYIFRLKIHKEI